MGKRNDAKWADQLHALGLRGRLPAVLTAKVLEAARAHRGERFTLPDGTVAGLYLQVGETGHTGFYLAYRSPTSGKRANMKIGTVEVADTACSWTFPETAAAASARRRARIASKQPHSGAGGSGGADEGPG